MSADELLNFAPADSRSGNPSKNLVTFDITADATVHSLSDALQVPLIDQDTVTRIIAFYFRPLVPSPELPLRVTVADNRYVPARPDAIVNFIQNDPILAPTSYVNDVFDCDDYVMHLRSQLALWAAHKKAPAPLAVGFLLTRVHAFNFCIDSASQLFVINTQAAVVNFTGERERFLDFLNLSASNGIQLIYI